MKLSPIRGQRGATVTISGKGFGKKRGTVKFGSVKCTRHVSWCATRIQCKVPAKARLGKLRVKVGNAAGASNAKSFTVKR